MKIKQISLFLENKPGHIAAPVRLLAAQGIDIRALYLAETQQFGVVRMIVADHRRAVEMLEANGFVVKTTEVVAVEVPDRPGGLADVLAALDGVNVEYMYAFPYARGEGAILIFRFDAPDAAIAPLRSAGITLVASKELLKH